MIDFGIARALDGLSASVQPTQIAGTPGYMSPEILRGQPVTPAVDVFAWGCVMAYARHRHPALPRRGRLRHPPPGADRTPRLEGLDGTPGQLVERALDKNPARRGSAAGLLAQLVGEEAADAGRATEVLERVWRTPTLVTAGPGQAAAPSRRNRGRRTAAVGPVPRRCAPRSPRSTVARGRRRTRAGQGPRPDTQRPGHPAQLLQLRTGHAPPAGAARWIDTRDATDDLRLQSRDSGAPDLMPTSRSWWSASWSPTRGSTPRPGVAGLAYHQ